LGLAIPGRFLSICNTFVSATMRQRLTKKKCSLAEISVANFPNKSKLAVAVFTAFYFVHLLTIINILIIKLVGDL
jgi:hypothetical protein